MDLRELLAGIATTYDRSAGMQSPAQGLLRNASKPVLASVLPAGYLVKGSGGQGAAAIVPWIAVFNPDETDRAQHGMYVVYLFKADMTQVVLSLNQGVTELVERFGTTEGRKRLVGQATEVRGAMPVLFDYAASIDLGGPPGLPRDYEAGNIAAVVYDTSSLPATDYLARDLHTFIRLYDNALDVRDALRIATPEKVVTTKNLPIPAVEKEFKPKDSSDYFQQIKAHELRKSRSHEKVVELYGQFLIAQGFEPNTNVHPRDLTADRDGKHWLIEVKTVFKGDGVQATREALAQLLWYKEVIYPQPAAVRLLAVFSESVGPLAVKVLEAHGIASVWRVGAGWVGSDSAVAAGLTTAGLSSTPNPPN